MSLRLIVENELIQDAESVWRLKNHTEFGYSDGTASEVYLRRVFENAVDLSTRSAELEKCIKDWPSEYHLSSKRAQLLSGFVFDRSLKVLEVGCGCGAITRHLGENFDQVVSVEGNIERARLARLRTRDLDPVSIVCAPFQEIRFSRRFDIIFCIGVLEYSASFIEADDPYDAALRFFSDMLTPEGMVVIAIENQFGMKYFNGAREDHLGTMFTGLEGYHRTPGKARTFGKIELENRLRTIFDDVEFYYPFPDYKIPDCVISSTFLKSGLAGELVSQMRSRDYSGPMRARWNESFAILELARNGMLEFFSNSFLVLAGRAAVDRGAFDQLALMYSSGRARNYSTRTRVIRSKNGEIVVEKRRLHHGDTSHDAPLKLVDTDSKWLDALSLQTIVARRASAHGRSLADIFEPCTPWIELLMSESSVEGGVRYLDGAHIDSIWCNAYPVDGECRIVDREWVWGRKIRLGAVVIRAIYDFLSRSELDDSLSSSLSSRSGRAVIRDIAAALGVRLSADDFADFIRLESELVSIASGTNRHRHVFHIQWFLADRPTRCYARLAKRLVGPFASRVLTRIHNVVPSLQTRRIPKAARRPSRSIGGKR